MNQKTAPNATGSHTVLKWVDWLLLLVVIGVSIVSLVTAWPLLTSRATLADDTKLSWHLVRAAGLTAYALLGGSTLWGLFLSSRVIKDWSPGLMSMLFHSTLSWLAVVLSVSHAALLIFDGYYTYTLRDLTIPFVGPYRPFAVGLGTIAAWLTIAITLSFSVRKLIGQRAWRWLHYGSYLTFGLITVHALLAGADATKLGMQIMMGTFTAILIVLFVWRVLTASANRKQNPSRRTTLANPIQPD